MDCDCLGFVKNEAVEGVREDLGVLSSQPALLERPRDGEVFDWNLRRAQVRLTIFLFIAGLVMGLVLMWGFTKFWPSLLLILPIFALVTNAGVAYMATDFTAGLASPRISAFNQHDSGTGTTAAAVTDTALQTPTGAARVAGVQTTPGSTNVYKTVATISYTASFAITEWGLFSATSSGTLWDHRVFAAISVVNGDAVQFSYSLTIPSGGT